MMNRYEHFSLVPQLFIFFLQAHLLACLAPIPVPFACKRLLTCTARTARPFRVPIPSLLGQYPTLEAKQFVYSSIPWTNCCGLLGLATAASSILAWISLCAACCRLARNSLAAQQQGDVPLCHFSCCVSASSLHKPPKKIKASRRCTPLAGFCPSICYKS